MNTIVKYANPVSNLIDELFNEAFVNSNNCRKPVKQNWPKVDIVEHQKEYKLYAELPGMTQQDITITVEESVLSIKGKKEEAKESDKENGYTYFERRSGDFSRSFNLPETVNDDSIEANLIDGLLILTIQKHDKKVPREISIS